MREVSVHAEITCGSETIRLGRSQSENTRFVGRYNKTHGKCSNWWFLRMHAAVLINDFIDSVLRKTDPRLNELLRQVITSSHWLP